MPILTPDIKSLFRAIPKTELHVHLAGAYPMYKMREFFREKGIPESQIAQATTVQDLYNDLTDFVDFYMGIAELVKSEEQLRDVTEAVCLKAAEDNVKYIELKLSAQELTPGGADTPESRYELREKMFKAVQEGVASAKQKLQEQGFEQVVKYMYTAERHSPAEISLEEARHAVEWAKQNNDFVGFDLAGDEINFSIERHKEAVDYARDNGLKITCHAGETSSSEEMSATEAMLRTIELGAVRIGHGLAVCSDDQLMDKIKQDDITIEVSPSSNISTVSVKDWADHPIIKMLENDILITICSDDPAMFNTKISKEYEMLYKKDILTDWDKIKSIVLQGVKASFASDDEKEKLLQDFTEELELIEQSEYFNQTIDRHLR